MNKRQKKAAILLGFVMTIMIGGLSYGFFTVANLIQGSRETTIATLDHLTMTLKDNGQKSISSAINSQNLSFTTYLAIENNGQGPQYVKLLFKNLINTYSEYLVYSLDEVQSIPESGEAVVLQKYNNQTPVPSSPASSNKLLANGVLVKGGTTSNTGAITPNTQYYRVTIEYLYSETVDQSEDVSSKLYTEFTMENGDTLRTISFVTAENHEKIDTMQVSSSKTVELPALVDENSGITGWYTDAVLTNKVTSSTLPSGNVTLYPKWETGYNLYVPDGTSLTWQELIDGKYLAVENNALAVDNDAKKMHTINTPMALIIDNNVTSLASYSLAGYSKLQSIYLPNSIKNIASGTFNGSGIKSLTIPNSVNSIGSNIIGGCPSLKKISVPGSITEIPPSSFSGSGIEKATLGNGIKTIGTSAFAGTSLKKINLPSTITTIRNNAFSGCSKLEKIVLPPSIENIDEDAFSGTHLSSLTIPDTIKSIGKDAFAAIAVIKYNGLLGDSDETWGAGIRNPYTEGDFAYKDNTKTELAAYLGNSPSVTIPSTVKTIASYAFAKNKLASVTIPNTVTSIGRGVFSGCTNLTTITIPSSVTSIGSSVFRGCSSLTSVTIPSSVTSIGSGTFYGCSSLTSVTIPSSVTSIESSAFYGCSSLTSITIPSSVTSIGTSAFNKCSSLTSVTIPSSVTSIESSAFNGCSSLTSVTIPNSITSINSGTFQNCTSLTSVTIPSSVTNIGLFAFDNDTNLTTVNYRGSSTNWNAITIEIYNDPLKTATKVYNYTD